MLNDIKPPPDLDRDGRLGAPPEPHHVRPHIDPKEPGLHHARIVGEPTHIDPEYAMPLEDRGSNFNIVMTCIAAGIVVIVLLTVVWWAVR